MKVATEAQRLVSINVGLPRAVLWQDSPVLTGIFKDPIAGPVMLRTLNLDGDRQADLSVHGGASKAAYAYPAEHYDYWRRDLPEMDLPWGMFGENFTTEGLSEATTNIGDQFAIGGAIVMVTEPRMPCYKLGIKFGSLDFQDFDGKMTGIVQQIAAGLDSLHSNRLFARALGPDQSALSGGKAEFPGLFARCWRKQRAIARKMGFTRKILPVFRN